ncbi:hypothetical protein C8J57DRAFT_754859 [Mycena rebaudengoi]|nr:hypothetical protein C8J57DRAFT_754859 [Mycena rebaudengoi]
MDAKMTSDLPTEVWRIAWLSASTKDLKSLALTCRLFCEITQPLLFQKLSFVGPFPEELHFGGKALNKRVVERLKRSKIRFAFLSSTPRIAAMVRGWSFNTSPDFTCPAVAHGIGARIPNFKKVSQLSRDIVAQFNSTISVYTNLDKLFITGFDLSPEFSKALSSLPKLRILHMLHCRIDCPPASGSIALEEFSFSSQELEWTDALPESHHLVSGSKLVRLDLQEPVPARLFLSVLSTAGPLPHLMHTTLCLTYEAKDAFFAFLDCCPALETLDIVAPASFAGVILPESSIPLLASYKGPMELVGIFVPGRPVKIAKLDAAATYELPEEFTGDVIIDKEVMIEALMQLSQSSAPLEDITLPPVSTKWSVLFLIHELFPKLKRLMLFVQDVGVPWGAETFQPEFDDEPEANESGESDDSAGEEGDEDAEGIMTLPVGEEEDEEWEDMEGRR